MVADMVADALDRAVAASEWGDGSGPQSMVTDMVADALGRAVAVAGLRPSNLDECRATVMAVAEERQIDLVAMHRPFLHGFKAAECFSPPAMTTIVCVSTPCVCVCPHPDADLLTMFPPIDSATDTSRTGKPRRRIRQWDRHALVRSRHRAAVSRRRRLDKHVLQHLRASTQRALDRDGAHSPPPDLHALLTGRNSADVRAMEKTCPSLYGGCHGVATNANQSKFNRTARQFRLVAKEAYRKITSQLATIEANAGIPHGLSATVTLSRFTCGKQLKEDTCRGVPSSHEHDMKDVRITFHDAVDLDLLQTHTEGIRDAAGTWQCTAHHNGKALTRVVDEHSQDTCMFHVPAVEGGKPVTYHYYIRELQECTETSLSRLYDTAVLEMAGRRAVEVHEADLPDGDHIQYRDAPPIGEDDHYDADDIKTETELDMRHHATFRRLTKLAIAGYNSNITQGERDTKFHAFLSLIKKHLRRMTGKVPRAIRESHRKQQLIGRCLAVDRTSSTPVLPRPACPTKQQQDAAAIKQAQSLAARKQLGKAASAMERVHINAVAFEAQIEKMRQLHPHGEPPPDLPCSADEHVAITVEQLRDAVANACKAAAPGPGGWTEELLLPVFKDPQAAEALANMATDVANNNISKSVRDRLTTCRLIGIPKPDGGVRPIAVSDIFLKAVAAVCVSKISATIAQHFADLQFGIMFEGGADHIVHNLRALMEEDPENQIVALDATNAFNTPSRESIALALYQGLTKAHYEHRLLGADDESDTRAPAPRSKEQEKFKSLWNLFMLEYGTPSDLMMHDGRGNKPTVIKSTRGSRQGSCTGGLYYALAIQPILEAAVEKFGKHGIKIFAYIDDISLVGKDAAKLSECATFFKEEFAKMNVALNPAKCEWYGSKQHDRTGVAVEFNKNQHVERVDEDGITSVIEVTTDERLPTDVPTTSGEPVKPGLKILGAYLSRDHDWISAQLEKKVDKHDVFFDRLDGMTQCTAAAILSACGIPRMSYYTRVHPPQDVLAAVRKFDARVERAWSNIAGCVVDDRIRHVAHLPASLGGGGLTRFELIMEESYRASYEEVINDSDESQATRVQRVNQRLRDELAATSARVEHHLEQCALPGSSAWFRTAVGSEHMDNEAFAAAFRARLYSYRPGAEIATCPGCGFREDEDPGQSFMQHVAGCTRIKGFNPSSRHAHFGKCFDACLELAGVQHIGKEPRDYKTSICPGCKLHDDSDVVERHVRTCEELTPKQRRTCKPHRSGPDRTVNLVIGDYTIDFNITCTEAKTWRKGDETKAYATVTRKKNGLYLEKCLMQKEQFVVFCCSHLGHLSKASVDMLDKVAREGGVAVDELKLRMSQCAIQDHGRVILNAEIAAGLTLKREPPQEDTSGRAVPGAPGTVTVTSPPPPAARRPRATPDVHCEEGHVLACRDVDSGFMCNHCRLVTDVPSQFHCSKCDYDLCCPCAHRYSIGGPAGLVDDCSEATAAATTAEFIADTAEHIHAFIAGEEANCRVALETQFAAEAAAAASTQRAALDTAADAARETVRSDEAAQHAALVVVHAEAKRLAAVRRAADAEDARRAALSLDEANARADLSRYHDDAGNAALRLGEQRAAAALRDAERDEVTARSSAHSEEVLTRAEVVGRFTEVAAVLTSHREQCVAVEGYEDERRDHCTERERDARELIANGLAAAIAATAGRQQEAAAMVAAEVSRRDSHAGSEASDRARIVRKFAAATADAARQQRSTRAQRRTREQQGVATDENTDRAEIEAADHAGRELLIRSAEDSRTWAATRRTALAAATAAEEREREALTTAASDAADALAGLAVDDRMALLTATSATHPNPQNNPNKNHTDETQRAPEATDDNTDLQVHATSLTNTGMKKKQSTRHSIARLAIVTIVLTSLALAYYFPRAALSTAFATTLSTATAALQLHSAVATVAPASVTNTINIGIVFIVLFVVSSSIVRRAAAITLSMARLASDRFGPRAVALAAATAVVTPMLAFTSVEFATFTDTSSHPMNVHLSASMSRPATAAEPLSAPAPPPADAGALVVWQEGAARASIAYVSTLAISSFSRGALVTVRFEVPTAVAGLALMVDGASVFKFFSLISCYLFSFTKPALLSPMDAELPLQNKKQVLRGTTSFTSFAPKSSSELRD